MVTHARCLLAARGVEETPMALAGAMMEAERDSLITGYIEALARQGAAT